MEYVSVTEGPGIRITKEAASMILTRYAFAADLCRGREVLEVASGPGMGLGYLAQSALRVVGSDCEQCFLEQARRHYSKRVSLVRLDAHALPFRDDSFDAVVLFEAIYYLPNPEAFVHECRRVLRSDGILLICTVNPRWPGFHPSPHSVRYLGGSELQEMLRMGGFDAQLYAAFPLPPPTLARTGLLQLRRLAVRLDLIPRTMKGKEVVKRVFSGRLIELPPEITSDFAETSPIVPLTAGREDQYKVLYLVARKDNVQRSAALSGSARYGNNS